MAKPSVIEAMKAKAQEQIAERIARLEESVQRIEAKLDALASKSKAKDS